jgi:phosphomevalonate kinase
MESLSSLTPFCPLPRPIQETNKTGLGSSAALVTSLVAGILSHLGLVDVSTPEGIDVVHSLAQAAHCLAQGKVGSGFDVASAVYGTHVYRRFSPSVLEPLFTEFERGEKGDAVYNVVHAGKWDQEARPLRLPRGLRLMLADVDAGTDTPSFVGRVLKWRKENPEEGESGFHGDARDIAVVQLVALLSGIRAPFLGMHPEATPLPLRLRDGFKCL